jgi:hypothetical protein
MLVMFCSILCVFVVVLILRDVSFDVASAVRTKFTTMQIPTQVLDVRGRSLGVFTDQTRYTIAYDDIPKHVKSCFLAAEDSGFFRHFGVSPKSLMRATASNIRKDSYAEGGSTITQQVVRQFLLARDKTLWRKFREIVLALALERQMTKHEILDLWLNSVYLGNNSWGVEAASQHYFNKSVTRLTVAEAAMLAGLPQAPSRYAPHIRYNAAKERQRYVLKRLQDLKWIRSAVYSQALAEHVRILPSRSEVTQRAPWVTEAVRLELWRRLEQKNLSKTGLVVNTTVDMEWQLDFQSLIQSELSAIRNDGLEASAVVLDTKSGDIRAVIGGVNFDKSQFNRAFDLNRPVGAAIYPIVFAWGMESGLLKIDGYSSMAEAAVRSRFAEAEQIAPEIGYGLLRDKMMGLGLAVNDAIGIDEIKGSPIKLARAYLGVGGARQFLPRGLVTSVADGEQIVYSSELAATKYPARLEPNFSWVIRKWMALGAIEDGSPLAGHPAMKAVKGWNSWWIIPRRDVVIAAWVGSDAREPRNPAKFKAADATMDRILAAWVSRNLGRYDGVGPSPEGVSYVVYSKGRGKPAVRVPFVYSGQEMF